MLLAHDQATSVLMASFKHSALLETDKYLDLILDMFAIAFATPASSFALLGGDDSAFALQFVFGAGCVVSWAWPVLLSDTNVSNMCHAETISSRNSFFKCKNNEVSDICSFMTHRPPSWEHFLQYAPADAQLSLGVAA